MSSSYYLWEGEDLLFYVFLQPRASRNVLQGLHDNALKISLTSPPVDGEANKQLLQFLSKLFRVKKSNLSIVAGAHNRRKRVRVRAPSQLPADFFR
ncbi:MAG: DUF167 family protein [Cycloclasticus sp.]|nr:YggU family protein [Cycloclasticus sp. 46_83_sub15_T18]OUR82099.1 YggU family protein [Cycloclasticus sp. 46_120_T64]